MLCSCGSNSFDKFQESINEYKIKYTSCKSCGRVGRERLFKNNISIDTGIKARRIYQNITSIK